MGMSYTLLLLKECRHVESHECVYLMHTPELTSVLLHVYNLIDTPEMMCGKCAPTLETYLALDKEVLIADSKSDKGHQNRTIP